MHCAHGEGLHCALHPQLQRPFSHRGYVMCPTGLTTGLSLSHSPLCNIILENTTWHKAWENKQIETYNQGQNNTMPIASSDDEVFLTQTTWIYIMFKPKSQIKMILELTSCKGGQGGFWTFCPYLHGLCCTGEAEGSRGQAQPESTGKHGSTFEQVRACKRAKHLDTLF